MDNFTERMLERTHRRQELLVSASLDLPIKEPSPSPVVATLASTQKSPPQRMRRNRFAELASRVDMWLEEDTDFKPKSIENDPTVTLNNHMSKQAANKSTTIPSLPPVVTERKLIETDNNKSTLTQQPEPQFNFSLMQRHHPPQRSPDNELMPHCPNLVKTALTVAQRRALFEKNIAPKQQIKKPTNTTIVTISLTKTTATKTTDTTATVAAEKEHNEPVLEVMTTPPRPIPCSKTTPPSRCGTRPRGSPAVVALGNLSPKPRTAWTPPCIKNVLLKKNLMTELDDNQSKILENEKTGTIVATSSPVDNTRISSADCIAMSVRPVQFMSPSSSLYPDLSLIENDNERNNRETITSSLENQYTGFKRRSNRISALNTSTASSDTVYENTDDEMLGAKRSRCESKPTDDDGAAVGYQDMMTADTTAESSPIATGSTNTPIVTGSTNTPSSNISSSMLSDHTTDQTCVSFTYYRSDKHQELPLKLQQLIDEKPQINKGIEPALVHTISTYRKQQKQLRISGKPSSKEHTSQLESDDEKEEYSRSALLHQRLKLLDDDDEEEIKLQELETVAERARNLERVVVPEQDRIIEQATQALNICDVYRQKNGLRPVVSNKFAPEHLHAERLLLIAGLRRTDAVREAQRLRVERTLLPGGTDRHLKIQGNGRTLVIESLRVPILSAVVSSSNKVTENLTRWPGGYRYFVCAIRAAATRHRPPVTSATRPIDAIEESLLRFSADGSVTRCGNDGMDFGYVEFITKKQIKLSGGRKWPVPTEAEGAPIMIHGLDDEGWKITIELYGVSPTAATGEQDHHNGSNNSKEHDGHENIKSVLDKFWNTVTTPSKESKKHATTASTCIESPGGPMAVRNTVFRQLGYFVFSDRQVDRQQFTLNKVHQSRNLTSTSKTTVDETVRVRMCLLEEGEEYMYDSGEGLGNFDDPSPDSNKQHDNSPCAWAAAARKSLRFPSECKRTEGFLTLFDDHELRTTPAFEQEAKWRPHSSVSRMTVWRRLWFCAKVIDNPKQLEIHDISGDQTQQQQMNVRRQKTIVLRCWLYPEHAEQQREPIGTIDLGRCLQMNTSTSKQPMPVPAAPALPDLCLRPNTLRLLLYSNGNYDGKGINDHDDPLLLSADTADERREWCDTINAAVHAISEHRKCIEIAEAARLKQKQQDKDDEHRQRLQNEHHTGAWPPISGGSGKSFGRKKKLHK